MNKKIILSVLISMMVFIAGCGNKQVKQPVSNTNSLNSITYKLTKNVYKTKNVIINYPQITNLGNDNKQKTINKLIKNDALKVLNYYNSEIDGLELEINYDIKLSNKNLLSIQYSGIGYNKGAAYPNNLFYTTNIDIKNAKKLRLADLVKIDETFVEKVKEGELINCLGYTNPDDIEKLRAAIITELNEVSSSELIKELNEADNVGDIDSSNEFSYLTKDSIGISIDVSHALGDHAEFEIKYKDIRGGVY